MHKYLILIFFITNAFDSDYKRYFIYLHVIR